MRIVSKGISHQPKEIEFIFNGTALSGVEGDTIASALIANDEYSCRQTTDAPSVTGSERGVFCGMGVCNECVVEVNGEPGVLSCMTSLKSDMKVNLQPAKPLVEDSQDIQELPEQAISADVLIIGAGPAGLAAASSLADAGAKVVLVDERSSLGGQYFKQPIEARIENVNALDEQYRSGLSLINDVKNRNITILTGVKIWGAFSTDQILGHSQTQRYHFSARHVILSTGAYERPLPMPGWTLPGVMTSGAAQTLMRRYQVAPGSRVFISGNGPLNLQVAAELLRAGVRVVAVVEAARVTSPLNAFRGLWLAATSPKLALRGLGYILALKRAKVPFITGATAVRFDGKDRVERVVVQEITKDGRADAHTTQQFDIDSACLGFGFLSSNEIARALGCRHEIDPRNGQLVATRAANGRSSLSNVWILGDSAQILGAPVAQNSGAMAAAHILAELGLVASIKTKAARHRRLLTFQKYLWRIYATPPLLTQFADDDTIICRCLSIAKGSISDALTQDIQSAGSIKRATRAGMGKCQGRYCSPVIQTMAAQSTGDQIDEFSGFVSQAPFKPTAIGVMAAPNNPE